MGKPYQHQQVPLPAPIHHQTHSSPATMQETLAVASARPLHLSQRSFDASTPANGLVPLPPSWEMCLTEEGKVYFLNHMTQMTSWDDPRQQQQPIGQQQENGGSWSQFLQPPHLSVGVNAQQRSSSFDSIVPVPQGWEEDITPHGPDTGVAVQRNTTGVDAVKTAQRMEEDARLLHLDATIHTLQLQREVLKKKIDRRLSHSQEDMQTQKMHRLQTTTNPGPTFSIKSSSHQQHSSSVHHNQESVDSGVGSNVGLGSVVIGSAMDTNDPAAAVPAASNLGSSNPNPPPSIIEQLIRCFPAELGDDLSDDIVQDVLNNRGTTGDNM
jgi:hypothetical protein